MEGSQFTGEMEPDAILSEMQARFPKSRVVLTLGKDGAIYKDKIEIYRHGIYDVPVVDTTAAGDTFTGFFMASLINGETPENALHCASIASSLAVSKKGAVSSIPTKKDVNQAYLLPILSGK